MSILIERASMFAIGAHEACGQTRKYTGEPYWHHPRAVAGMVNACSFSSEWAVAAAWLHDVVEDTAVSIETIEAQFGYEVAVLVRAVTKDDYPETMNRAARMSAEVRRITQAIASAPRLLAPEIATIKLADLLHNTSSIVEHDPKFALRYMTEKRALLCVLKGGDARLYDHANERVEDFFNKVNA